MKCPHCSHQQAKGVSRCLECAQPFDVETQETLENLDYLLTWLGRQEHRIPSGLRRRLEEDVKAGRTRLRAALEWPKRRAGDLASRRLSSIGRELALLDASIKLITNLRRAAAIEEGKTQRLIAALRSQAERMTTALGGYEGTAELQEDAKVVEYALGAIEDWQKHTGDKGIKPIVGRLIQRKASFQLVEALPAPAPAPTPRPEPAAPPATTTPAGEPAPAATQSLPSRLSQKPPAREPKPLREPRGPIINWSDLWEKTVEAAVSGALLRGFLYLGAFMIVVSAATLVIRFWDIFPAVVQLLLIFSVPAGFYLAGWLVRSRLELPQASAVLTAVGALLVAVDLAAVYQFGGLESQVPLNTYWLGGSLFCTLIYGLTAWRMPEALFAYLPLIGVINAVLALTRLLVLPLEWSIVAAAAAGTAMIGGSIRLRGAAPSWAAFARASRRLPLVLLPLGALLALLVPGPAHAGQAATFALVALGSGLYAWAFPAAPFAHATIWAGVVAIGFSLGALSLPLAWFPTAGSLLAWAMLVLHTWGDARLAKDRPQRKAYLQAPLIAGYLLLGAAGLGGLIALASELWPAVVGLVVVSAVVAGAAVLMKVPALIGVAAGLLIVPISASVIDRLPQEATAQPVAWLMAIWAGLALVYQLLSIALRRWKDHMRWLDLWTHLLAPAVCVVLGFNFVASPRSWSAVPTLVALGGAILVYLLAVISSELNWWAMPASIRESFAGSELFALAAAVLLPLWVSVLWNLIPVIWPWLGPVIAGLGLAYIGLGQVLVRRRGAYQVVLHLCAYALGVVAILLSLGDPYALLVALIGTLGILLARAVIQRWMADVALAALLAIWPFQLTLNLVGLSPHAQALAYVLLVITLYTPVSLLLKRSTPRLALPVEWVAHGLTLLSVGWALAGRFDLFEVELSWVSAMTPALAAALTLFYVVYHDSRTPFAWAAVVFCTLAYWNLLNWLNVPLEFHTVNWVGLAGIYLLLERAVLLTRLKRWLSPLGVPLLAGTVLLGMLGLGLTAGPSWRLFNGVAEPHPEAPIIAQVIGLLLAGLVAWLYRRRWPSHLAAWLSVVAFTLSWIAYGSHLAPVEYAWPWLGWSALLMLVGYALDRVQIRYAHGPYLAGFALAGYALVVSMADQHTHLYTLGGILVMALVFDLLVHLRRFNTFEDLINLLWEVPGGVSYRAGRTVFAFLLAYGLPIWLVQLLHYHGVPLAWRGMALALAAPVFVALGLFGRRIRAEYCWPWFSAGYALTAIGAAVAYQDLELMVYVLTLNILVYAASAYIFRQAFWLYLSTALTPVVALLVLSHNDLLTPPWVSGVLMGLAVIYTLVGRGYDWRTLRPPADRRSISPMALAFHAPGYLLCATALAVGCRERTLALTIYSIGALLFAFSTWAFRETLFIYPFAWLSAVPYFLLVTLTGLPDQWYGLGWLPLIVAYIGIGRFVLQREPLEIRNLPSLVSALARPSMPFYLLAYGLSVSMVALSASDPNILTVSLVVSGALYFGSAALFRWRWWLYPGLVASHLALAAFYSPSGDGPSQSPHLLAVPFMALTWITALVGYLFGRRVAVDQQADPTQPSLNLLLTPSWAQPFLVVALVDLVVWQVVALGGLDTAAIVALGFGLLLGLLASLWQDRGLPYGGLAYLALALGCWLGWLALPLQTAMIWVAAAGLGLFALASLLEWIGRGREGVVSIWIRPLTLFGVVMGSLAALVSAPNVQDPSTELAVVAGLAGALYMALGYRQRTRWVGYLGLALLEVSWAILLLTWDAQEPQLYAIPAGIYFVAIGTLERRHRSDAFPRIVECFGLAVMLVTSFIQSLDGAAGFPYFVLLLAEGLVVVGWGAWRCIKIPFFVGLGASFLNVVAQVVVLIRVHQVNRYFVMFGVGTLLVTLAVWIERRREQIVLRTQEWRGVLEGWD